MFMENSGVKLCHKTKMVTFSSSAGFHNPPHKAAVTFDVTQSGETVAVCHVTHVVHMPQISVS